MKWIAKRDFYRTPKWAELQIIGGCKGAADLVDCGDDDHAMKGKKVSSVHRDQIHIGAIFEYGRWKDENEFVQAKAGPEKTNIAELRAAGCIGDATDTEVVKRIESEIAVIKKKKEREEADAKRSNGQAIADAIAEGVKKALSAPAK